MLYDRLQLPLPFKHQPRFEAGDFIPARSNRDALAWLDIDWPEHRLALFGAAGTGKSHLLHIWAQRTGAVLLGGPAVTNLADLPASGAVALDDADTITDETLLFHLLNTARDRGLRLLLSARTAPARWPVRLPDLSSRLRAITAAEIQAPAEGLLAALLKRLAVDRQLVMTQAAQDWLLLHLPRSPAVLREAVAQLDRRSLVSGGAITRALAAEVVDASGLAIADADEVSISRSDPSSAATGFL